MTAERWEEMGLAALKIKDRDPERFAEFVRKVGVVMWDVVHTDCPADCICQREASLHNGNGAGLCRILGQ